MKILVGLLLLFATPTWQELDVLETYKHANLMFASDLYVELLKTEKHSFVFSPLAIQYGLFPALLKAEGATAVELSSILRLANNRSFLHSVNQILSEHLKHCKNVVAEKIDEGEFVVRAKVMDSATMELNKDFSDLREFYPTPDSKEYWEMSNIVQNSRVFRFLTDFDGYFIHKFTKYGDWYPIGIAIDSYPFYYNQELNCTYLVLPFNETDVTVTIVLTHDIESLNLHMYEVLNTVPNDTVEVDIKIPIDFTIRSDLRLTPTLLSLRTVLSDEAKVEALSFPYKMYEVFQRTTFQMKTGIVNASSAQLNIITKKKQQKREVKQFIANRPFIFYVKHKILGLLFVGRLLKKFTLA